MKKFLTLLFLGLIVSSASYGQCVPDPSYTLPGIYPDSATGFPQAFATFPYDFVITAVIPVDTLLPIFGRRNIDSIGVVEVTGLPAGFTAVTNSASGYWPGGSSGCMKISGTPTPQQVGNYPLDFLLAGWAQGIPFPFTFNLTYYKIIIRDSVAVGIERQVTEEIFELNVSPNPFRDNLALRFSSQYENEYLIEVFDMYGRLIFTRNYMAGLGSNTVNFNSSDWKKGIYLGRITNRNSSQSKAIKLIKN